MLQPAVSPELSLHPNRLPDYPTMLTTVEGHKVTVVHWPICGWSIFKAWHRLALGRGRRRANQKLHLTKVWSPLRACEAGV